MKFLYTLFLLSLANFGKAQSAPALTAAFDKNAHAVRLHWQNSDEKITSYILQRSGDGYSFSDICVKTVTGDSNNILKYTDADLRDGRNYYRLKIIRGSSAQEFTMPLIIITGENENSWVIYPVPVGSVLHLQYTGSGVIEDVITVTIQSVNSGTVFTHIRMASNTRNIEIPVSNLGKGLYDIHISIGNRAVWNQRFVK